MHLWTITAFDSAPPVAQGSDPQAAQAWKDAIAAALNQFTASTVDGCVIVMDGAPAWLMPGRTDDGLLDVPATRAAAERMAMAAIGGLF